MLLNIGHVEEAAHLPFVSGHTCCWTVLNTTSESSQVFPQPLSFSLYYFFLYVFKCFIDCAWLVLWAFKCSEVN